MAAKNTKMINDVFGRKSIVTHDPDTFWPLPSELIGLEIEVEELDRNVSLAPHWTQHQDGSLRNGTEFVLSAPTGGRTLTEAINSFFNAGLSYTISPRTSIHVHINASDNMTVDQFRNMFVIMYLIEPAVFRWADENRKWCGYCSPLTDLTPSRIINILNDSRDEIRFVHAVRGDGNSDRYYGFNVSAYHRHGTVEFRYFPCTTERERVVDWIKFCMYVKKAARRHGSPEDILALLQNQAGLTNFINEWFGDVASNIVRLLDFEDCLNRVKDMGTMVNVSPDSLRNPDAYHRSVRSRGFNRFVTRSFPDAPPVAEDATTAANSASDELARYLAGGSLARTPRTYAQITEAMPPSAAAVAADRSRREQLRQQLDVAELRYQRARSQYGANPSSLNRSRMNARAGERDAIQSLLLNLT